MGKRSITRSIGVVVAAVLLLVTCSWSNAQTSTTRPATQRSAAWKGPFFFIQMSDPQFGMFTSNADFAQETINYEKAIAAANKLKPAFVVITGDLVHKPGDPAQIAEMKRISAKIDPSIPLRLLSGNHDVENVPTAASLAFYRKEIGTDYYSWDFGGCHFIGINSTILMRPDVPEELDRQMAWIKQDLTAAAATGPQHTMLFGHHPLFITRVEEAETGNSIPVVRRKALLDLLTSNRAMFMFAGHLHRNAGGKAGDFQMTTTGAVGKPLGTDPSGFRVIKVYEDRVEHDYIPLDKVPEKIVILEK